MAMKSAYWLWTIILLCTGIDSHSKRNLLNAHKYFVDRSSPPLRATSDIENIIFPNKWLLKADSRIRKDLKRIALRNCVYDYNIIYCNKFKPICAVTFDNSCKRTLNNICVFFKNGCPMKKDTETFVRKTNQRKRNVQEYRRRPIPCPRIFSPVCAYLAGVKSTFINECLVNAENVKYDKDWIVFSKGVCAEDFSYYSPRSHKSKRSVSQNQFEEFDENFFLGDDVIQIRPPSIFQTQFFKQEIPKTFVDDIDPFGYQQIYRQKETFLPEPNFNYKNYLKNVDNEDIFFRNIPTKHKPFLSFGSQPNSYNYLDSTLKNIIENLQTDEHAHKNSNPINIFDCKLGNKPLCCGFQGGENTFKNICELNMHNENTGQDWQISYEGPCRSCENNCPTNFDPVCASRKGLNYTIRNECLLKFEMCRDKIRGWKILNKGVCENNELKIIRDKYESKPHGFKFITKFKKMQNDGKVQIEASSSKKTTRPSFILSPSSSSSVLNTNSSKLSDLVLPKHGKYNPRKKEHATTHRIISNNNFEVKTSNNSKAKKKSLVDKLVNTFPSVIPSHENNLNSSSENHNTKTHKSLRTPSAFKSTIGNIENSSQDAIFIIKYTNNISLPNTNNTWNQSASVKESLPSNVPSANETIEIKV